VSSAEIRQLRRGDGDRLRDIRLRALADSPYAFSSSSARESRLEQEFWDERVAASERGEAAVFAAIEHDQGLGMAGGFFDDGEPEVATLWGMWVDPVGRRRGIAQALVEAVADWARGRGADRVRLAVTDCEESKPAAALYHKLGFADTGEREPLDWNPSLISRVLSRSA
jgi:GNAT superfamily N-acetyltransferase